MQSSISRLWLIGLFADNPDTGADEAKIRCCIESICDTTFANALQCLTGLVSQNSDPAG